MRTFCDDTRILGLGSKPHQNMQEGLRNVMYYTTTTTRWEALCKVVVPNSATYLNFTPIF